MTVFSSLILTYSSKARTSFHTQYVVGETRESWHIQMPVQCSFKVNRQDMNGIQIFFTYSQLHIDTCAPIALIVLHKKFNMHVQTLDSQVASTKLITYYSICQEMQWLNSHHPKQEGCFSLCNTQSHNSGKSCTPHIHRSRLSICVCHRFFYKTKIIIGYSYNSVILVSPF